MPRFFKVKIQHTMMIPEKEMRTVLASRADLLDLDDDKELEWQILDDTGTVNALELLAVIAKAGVKIQISVVQEDPEEFVEDEEPAPDALWGYGEDGTTPVERPESDHGKLAQETVQEWRESDVLVMLNQGKSVRKISKKTGIPFEKVLAIQRRYEPVSQDAPEGHPT